jgi:glycosyltransferase involved in cell wall biosynthesis
MSDFAAVSVILIVRNGEDYIGAALESVVQGEYRPSEILVIDGDSTDRTCEIARTFPLVRVVHQQTRGITDAYNEGIAAARSDTVAFISHDDLWEPDKLALQMLDLRTHPQAQYCVCMVQHFLNPGDEIPEGFRPELLQTPVTGMIMEALVARKSVFERVGSFNADFSVSSDTEWFARARDAGVPMNVVPKTLVRKRVHGSNNSIHFKNLNQLLLRAMRDSVRRKTRTATAYKT